MIKAIMNNKKIDQSVKGLFALKTETDEKGNTYTGQFYQGHRHGHGKIIFGEADENKRVDFTGQFIKGSRTYGRTRYRNRCQYLGEFAKELGEGRGIYTFDDGVRTLEGLWINGTPNGHVIRKWPNGDSYIGGYLENDQHGLGFLREFSTLIMGR